MINKPNGIDPQRLSCILLPEARNQVVSIFGSTLRKDFRLESDINLLVELFKGLLPKIMTTEIWLGKLEFPTNSDSTLTIRKRPEWVEEQA